MIHTIETKTHEAEAIVQSLIDSGRAVERAVPRNAPDRNLTNLSARELIKKLQEIVDPADYEERLKSLYEGRGDE